VRASMNRVEGVIVRFLRTPAGFADIVATDGIGCAVHTSATKLGARQFRFLGRCISCGDC
jgi:hypothetical protein